MFSTSDTIVAIATPPGRGGIGVVRLSGPDAHRIGRGLTTHTAAFEPRRATFSRVRLEANAQCGASDAIDHVVATYFPGPRSYTGEHVMELSAHGSPVVLRAIVTAATAAGARLAQPGEFTLRAFLNGRIDLTQAEAVADLIDAVTPLQARAAFDQLQGTLTDRIREIDHALLDLIARLEASVDFPEEGYHFIEPPDVVRVIDQLLERTKALLADARRGRLLRDGFQMAIAGKPNVGKSSLFNALIGTARAIVTTVPGTTRDLLTELVDLDGLRVTVVDTAGLRETGDLVESEGVERAWKAQGVSDLVLVVLDGSNALDDMDRRILAETSGLNRLVVINKADLAAAWSEPQWLRISAKTLDGLQSLREALVAALDVEPWRERPEITNVRHSDLVQRAHGSLERARRAAEARGGARLSEEFVLADLQEARAALDEVVGRRTSEDVLAHIFSKFCLGK